MKTNEEILAENAMLRLQIETLYNGSTYVDPENNVPADIENQFLRNIVNFEQAMSKSAPVPLRQRLGLVNIPQVSELKSMTETAFYLDQLVEAMDQCDIDFLYEDRHDKREVYRYLVEFLLDEIVDDVRIAGFRTVFFFDEDWEENR